MEKIKSFVKNHPTETALLAGVSLVALYFLFFGGKSSQSQAGSLESAYYAAETTQAQTGAAIQIAGINAGRDVSLAQIGAGASTQNATTWANTDLSITQSNNQAATSALPYAAESHLVDALAGIAGQTSTTQSKGGGFSLGPFSFGGGSKQITTSTPAAISASTYLDELAAGNHSFAING